MATSAADRYIDLLIECVNGSVYGTPQQLVEQQPSSTRGRLVASALRQRGKVIAAPQSVSQQSLELGLGWPDQRWNPGESMIGRSRLRMLAEAVKTVVAEGVDGDLIETGVWRGGSCILMKGALEALGSGDRRVFVADSFRGLPEADESDDAADLHLDATLAISKDDVAAAFGRYRLLDDKVIFLEGWFSDTLPSLSGQRWSVIRLDGDMYESTRDAIVSLYPRLSPGGFCIIDDYHAYESCRRATDEYRVQNAIQSPLVEIDGTGVYWRKNQT